MINEHPIRAETIRLAVLGLLVVALFAALSFERISSLQTPAIAWLDASDKIDRQAPANAVGRWRPLINLGTETQEQGNYTEAFRLFSQAEALGEPLGSRTTLEDLHFTPLNRKQIGRSLPDKYGLVIQANILSMMLHRDYITPTPRWLEVLLAFGVCYCQMLFFMYLNVKHALWYHPLSAVVQFGSGAVLVYLAIALYVGANLDLGVAFAVLTVVVGLRVLSLYGALASWLHRKWGFRSYVVRS